MNHLKLLAALALTLFPLISLASSPTPSQVIPSVQPLLPAVPALHRSQIPHVQTSDSAPLSDFNPSQQASADHRQIAIDDPSDSIPSPSHPSISPSVPEEQVFISLKEWKQQKLRHIESRMRNNHARQPRSAQKLGGKHSGDQLKLRRFLLSFFQRVCHPDNDTLYTNTSTTFHKMDFYAEKSDSNTNYEPKYSASPHVNHMQSERTSQSAQVTKLPVQSPLASLNSSRSLASQRTRLGISDPADADSFHIRHDELDGLHHRAFSFRPTIHIPNLLPNVMPKVGSLFKSILEVSYFFSTPPVPIFLYSQKMKPPPNKSFLSTNKTNITSTSSLSASSRQTDPSGHKFARSSRGEKSSAGNPPMNDSIGNPSASGANEKPFNFASADAGARVLAHSDGIVGAKNVITGSVDKYLLASCPGPGLAGSRWVDLELSEDVILESIETANLEYYSSSARRVAILGASTYPPKRWNVLGVFDFSNVRKIQRFYITKRIVTRFLRVMYAGKQGNEFYCPVSTIRAFGKNLIADWKDVFEKKSSGGVPYAARGDKAKGKLLSGFNGRVHDLGGNNKGGSRTAGHENHTPSFSLSPRQLDSRGRSDKRKSASMTTGSHEDEGKEEAGILSKPGSDEPSKSSSEESGSVERDVDIDATIREAKSTKAGNAAFEEVKEKVDASSHDGTEESDVETMSDDDRIVLEAVRSDALTPVSGDDNIFRKVTQMIRLLELNQTLTNQYIDSQLSKFAKALSSTHSKSSAVEKKVSVVEKEMMQMVIRLEGRIDVLQEWSLKRDIMICLLLICVAFLIGANCVLWTAISGARLFSEAEEKLLLDDYDMGKMDKYACTEVAKQLRVDECASVTTPATRRRRKKSGKALTGIRNSQVGRQELRDELNEDTSSFSWNPRSASSFELSSSKVSVPQSARGGAFEVLRSNEE